MPSETIPQGCCADSAYEPKVRSSESITASIASVTPRWSLENPGSILRQDTENCGATVTEKQQWKALVAACLQAFWVVGLIQSFGIWQRHYGSNAAVQNGIVDSSEMTRRAMIATIGSLGNGGLVAVFGIIYLPFLPQIGKYIKILCFVATLLVSFGFALAAVNNGLATLIIFQGLFVGTGCGIFIYTLNPILPEYFNQHSGLAQGVQMATASAGGAALSMATPQLLNAVGTRKTLGILALASFVVCSCVSMLAQSPRKFEKRASHMVSWRDLKRLDFTLLLAANFIHPLTVTIPLTFGPAFSGSIHMSGRMGSALLAMGSAVGCPSRFANGYFADRIGHVNMLLLATVVYAVGTWGLWFTAARTNNGPFWIMFNVLYGVVNGTFNTVINSIQRQLFGDEMYYPYNGAMTSVRGIGYVVGVPIAGALVRGVQDAELSGDDFTAIIVYAGSLLAVSVLCLGGVRVVDGLRHGWWKV